jgi:hypothetical protein
MADKVPQNFANHGKFVPPFHFVLIPILTINLGWRIYQFGYHIMKTHDRADPSMNLLLAVAFVGTALFARIFALQAQDRVIRLEEAMRMQRLLPDALKSRISEIGRPQMIALRFAPDDELSGLVGRVLAGDLQDSKAIKQAIKNWRGDYHRL